MKLLNHNLQRPANITTSRRDVYLVNYTHDLDYKNIYTYNATTLLLLKRPTAGYTLIHSHTPRTPDYSPQMKTEPGVNVVGPTQHRRRKDTPHRLLPVVERGGKGRKRRRRISPDTPLNRDKSHTECL